LNLWFQENIKTSALSVQNLEVVDWRRSFCHKYFSFNSCSGNGCW